MKGSKYRLIEYMDRLKKRLIIPVYYIYPFPLT